MRLAATLDQFTVDAAKGLRVYGQRCQKVLTGRIREGCSSQSLSQKSPLTILGGRNLTGYYY